MSPYEIICLFEKYLTFLQFHFSAVLGSFVFLTMVRNVVNGEATELYK